MGPDAEESLQDAASLVRAYGAVAIVGAGVSVEAGYPMLPQFLPLLRNSLLEDSKCREDLGKEFEPFVNGISSTLDSDELKLIYDSISRHPKARGALQRAFALRDHEQTERGGSWYMTDLAQLLHSRSIVAVLSLNWDTQLEAAYEREYGRRLEADGGWLTKPHGDARKPDDPWVLPFQPSNLSPKILEKVRDLANNRVRVLLMMGYSGQDEEIVSKIIEPLADHWKVVRIGPGLKAPDISMTASEAIPRLRILLGDEKQKEGWEYVRFSPSNGLVHALSGRGLLPGDAQDCPSVPEVDRIVRELRVNRSAYLLGDSGSGKSLIAYQAALKFSHDGWEVARLRPGGTGTLDNFPHPTLAIVDDAQARPEAEIRLIYESANERSAVLVISNEQILGIDATVKVASKRSVSVLAEWVRKNIDTVKPLVMSLDKDVGDGYLDTPFEQRIDQAEEQADRPWTFNFILTGGWRRAREEMASLQEASDADLVLFAVSAGQLVSADVGLDEKDLLQILVRAGISDSDFGAGLQRLRSMKLVLDGARLKCPHLGYAAVVVRYICDRPDDPRWGMIGKIIEGIFDSGDRKMLGCNWLLFELRFSNGFRWPEQRTAISESAKRWFSQSIWHAASSEEIRSGLFALERLPGWLPDFNSQIEANLLSLARYIENADEVTAHAAAHFVNWFSQDRSMTNLFERLFKMISPQKAALVFHQATSTNAYAFANFAGRLSNCAPKPWVGRWRKFLPWTYFEQVVDGLKPRDVYAGAELVYNLLYSKDRRWDKLFWQLAPKLADSINDDALKAAREIDFVFWHILDIPALKKFWNLINPVAFGHAYSVGKPRDWHRLQVPLICFWHGRRSRSRQISKNVNFDQLLNSSDRFSDKEHKELISVLYNLATFSDRGPVLAWLKNKGHLFDSVSRELATLLPARASELILAGSTITLRMDGGFWGAVVTADSVRQLFEYSPEAAKIAISQNIEELSKPLRLNPSDRDSEGIADLIRVAIQSAPETILEVVKVSDKSALTRNWRIALEGKDTHLKSTIEDLVVLMSSHFSEFDDLLSIIGAT